MHNLPGPLARAPKYVALSYTWEKTIQLNGRICSVRENLEMALDHLRKDHSELPLWVDALCINQKDNSEKSWQAQQMNHMYQNAESVTVWLGPSANNSDLLFRTLARHPGISTQPALGLTLNRFLSLVWTNGAAFSSTSGPCL